MGMEFYYWALSTTPRVNRVTHCKLPTRRSDWFIIDAIDDAYFIIVIAAAIVAAIQSNTL